MARSQRTNNNKGDGRRRSLLLAVCLLVFFSAVAYQITSVASFYEFLTFDMVLSQQVIQEQTLIPQQLFTTSVRERTLAAVTTTQANVPLKNDGFTFYYPTLYNDTSSFANDPWIGVPFLHILETPLIQNQLNLTLLIESRLGLFEAFCYPSIRKQTSRNFIWIIRVDTRLSTERQRWLRRLIDLLQDDPRFYLMERDSNPPWRNGQASQQLSRSKVYTGDQRRLEYYMASYEQKHILETRIDGDDGLHYKYLEHMEDKTLDFLAQDPPPAFFYWCVPQEIEWHPVILPRKPGPQTSIVPAPPSPYTHGLWMPGPTYGPKPPNNQDLCPTPGITRVYPVGTHADQVFRGGHHLLWSRFAYRKENCARPKDGPASPWKETNCTQFVRLDGASYPALRSRTPTSASMISVGGLNYGHLRKHYPQAHVYWNLTAHDFGLDPEPMRQMQAHVVDNLLAIAQEGLQGQCSKGHSCMVRLSKGQEACM